MARTLKHYLYNQYQCLKIYQDSVKKYSARTTKRPLLRYREAQLWQAKEGDYCKFYYAWGLNAAGTRLEDFIGRKEFLKLKCQAEKKLCKVNKLGELDYEVLTKDKFVAGSFLLANSIPCIPHHGFIKGGEYQPMEGHAAGLESLLDMEDEVYVKNVFLEASDGVIQCQISDGTLHVNGTKKSYPELHALLSKGVWIVQSRVQAHSRIRALNATALNTTRIVTILNKGLPQYLTGFQAFATGTAKTDSWDKGSIFVGIDLENGCLKEYGFHNLSDPDHSVSTQHPDSGIVFRGYNIPYLKEAVQLCLRAHRLFYNNFVIGWDVAITDNGPLIVEANEKPGMNAVQCVDGGLRKQILACYDALLKDDEDD